MKQYCLIVIDRMANLNPEAPARTVSEESRPPCGRLA
jgi:hypothetical protein